jgi:alpha-aminoadipate carrier protein LysW
MEIDVPDDVMEGEILSCEDCGLDLEIEIVDNKIEIIPIAIEKEDWGE